MIKLRNLIEGKQVGILYHYTSIPRLLSILKDNKLKITSSGRPYVSFTRDKNFHKSSRFGLGGNMDVRLVVDGNKLSQKYKITPYQYHFQDYDFKQDEAEEIVDKNIENIKSYLIQIDCFINEADFNNKVNHERGFESLLLRFLPDTEYSTFLNNIKI